MSSSGVTYRRVRGSFKLIDWLKSIVRWMSKRASLLASPTLVCFNSFMLHTLMIARTDQRMLLSLCDLVFMPLWATRRVKRESLFMKRILLASFESLVSSLGRILPRNVKLETSNMKSFCQMTRPASQRGSDEFSCSRGVSH